MNGFYLAGKQLRSAAILDTVCISCLSILIFIFAIFHFCYFLGSDGKYISSNGGSSPSSTFNYINSYVSSKGYGGLFNVELIDFLIFKLTLWNIVLLLFIVILFSFIGKVFLGSLSLYRFFKAKSIQHIYAALAVIFFPGLGGIIAMNTYKATTSRLAPKYIASHSAIRFKARSLWNNFSKSNTFDAEIKSKKNLLGN